LALPQQNRSSELLTPEQHYEHLHADALGVTIVWEKPATVGAGKWLKLKPGDGAIPAILSAQAGTMDRFLSVNEFHGWRTVSLLKSLRSMYVDIDGNVNLEEVLDTLARSKLPPPTSVMWSGRGLHLYWVHNPVPAKALPVWQRCQDLLIKTLKPLGADPAARDCTRILRLAGTINSKNMEPVRGVVYDAEPWNFHHLCDEVLGYRPPPTQPEVRADEPRKVVDFATKKAHRGERLRTNSIYDRWHHVYTDLIAIAEHHGPKGIPTGHRNNWLFLSAVALSWFASPQTLRDELRNQARRWTIGFSESDIKSTIDATIKRAEQAAAGQTRTGQGEEDDPRYKFSRERLWELMSPLVPASLEQKLRAIVGDEVRTEHKKTTNRAHEITRCRVLEGRHKSHNRGPEIDPTSIQQQMPWESKGISRASYFRHKALALVKTDCSPISLLQSVSAND
jgi:hypothetical protein